MVLTWLICQVTTCLLLQVWDWTVEEHHGHARGCLKTETRKDLFQLPQKCEWVIAKSQGAGLGNLSSDCVQNLVECPCSFSWAVSSAMVNIHSPPSLPLTRKQSFPLCPLWTFLTTKAVLLLFKDRKGPPEPPVFRELDRGGWGVGAAYQNCLLFYSQSEGL